MNPEYLAQVQSVVAQYHDLVQSAALNQDNPEWIAQQFDALLRSALTTFAHDVHSVTPETATLVCDRITLRQDKIAELAQQGVSPVSCPIQVDEFMQHMPGMIPLMLVKACVSRNFHDLLSPRSSISPTWREFVELYAPKLPSK